MVKGSGTSGKMWVYQDLLKTELKGILIFLEMNLDQNNCLYKEKRVAKKLLF